MKISVLGAGAWGTAIALHASAHHDVLLWGRDPQALRNMCATRCNQRYLPGVTLPHELGFEPDLGQALVHGGQGLIAVATPMSALRTVLQQLPDDACVVWLCKGFEAETGLLGHEVAAELKAELRCGVLSGPSFASEVARQQPTALVAASLDPQVGEATVQAFHAGALRVYTSQDPIGVEVGGAVKNVMAIATGVADGLQLGLNARAALITRGLAEMTRLGVALGARADTFMGLSGLGDLVLTATGDLSRNRRVGLELARGQPLAQVLQSLGHVAEGVYSARTIAQRAARLGVDLPLTDAVVALLDGALDARQAVQQLLQRDARSEG